MHDAQGVTEEDERSKRGQGCPESCTPDKWVMPWKL